MINVSTERIITAIRRDSPLIKEKSATALAERVRDTTDSRLEKNVLEWIEGENITDIWIGRYCINAIMSMRGDRDFIDALEAMNLYLSDEKAGIRRIWRPRA